jgi:hypothetical protein
VDHFELHRKIWLLSGKIYIMGALTPMVALAVLFLPTCSSFSTPQTKWALCQHSDVSDHSFKVLAALIEPEVVLKGEKWSFGLTADLDGASGKNTTGLVQEVSMRLHLPRWYC